MSNECIFCKIINKEIPSVVLHEDEDFLVILDKFPSRPGHTLILPKKHVANIFEMEEEMAAKLFALASKMASKLKEATNCDGMNILQNNGEVAGQTIFHFHLHLIPRYENDDVKIHWEPKEAEDEILNEIKNKIN